MNWRGWGIIPGGPPVYVIGCSYHKEQQYILAWFCGGNVNCFWDIWPLMNRRGGAFTQGTISPIRTYTVYKSVIELWLKPLFTTNDVSKFRDGIVHFRKSRMKELNQHYYFLPQSSFVPERVGVSEIHHRLCGSPCSWSRWSWGGRCWTFFLIFPRELDLTFHANCLYWYKVSLQYGQ